MKKSIYVVDDSNQMLGTTYEGRAKQLIKKGRAKWIDNQTIAISGDSVTISEFEDDDSEMEIAVPVSNGSRNSDVSSVRTTDYRRRKPPFSNFFLNVFKKKYTTHGLDDVVDLVAEVTEEKHDTAYVRYVHSRLVKRRRVILHFTIYVIAFFTTVIVYNEAHNDFVSIFLDCLQLWIIPVGAHIMLYFTQITPKSIKKEMKRMK